MKHLLQKTMLGGASLMLVLSVVSATAVAHARPGSSHDDSVATSPTASPTPENGDEMMQTTSDESDSGETNTRKANREAVKQRIEGHKAKAADTISKMKEKSSGKSAEDRQKSCEARANSIEKRLGKAVEHATKHKAVFDKIYDRAKTFKTEKQLESADYDSLVAAADEAGTAADASITALQGLNVAVDCTNPDAVATNLTAFKQGTDEAKTALKAYREAIKNVIKSIKASADAAEGDTSGTEE